ncbi:hypothetical protein B0J15DRAFT_575273 [Fusarium solani]|uniref:Alcohol dehydrogenase-like N-terminal domain-containing protein n=1 Tax=Fusarium solani TaxID=169388 RepID=A0A9P9G1J4_FUSSL|nr:uncharacterized protein B0J15DRAFT_575273 [Fusarium solani]KAH7230781.1 hypothetical protein B0J15DRAFT_575273 [Fusarium solani]
MSQKALLLEEVGKPLVLLVKVLVAGLNPHDQRTRDAGLFVTSMPYVLASDLVGEVVTVGTGEYSAKFTLGERVFGHTFAEGGFHNDFNGAQQYALVDARFVGRVASSGLSNDEASTIPVIVLAGFIALFASSSHGLPLPFSPEVKSFDFASVTLLVIGGGSNTRRALGVAALSNTKKGTLITLRRPDGDFDTARIGSKSAGYKRRLMLGVSPVHPDVTMGSFEVIKGLNADAINKALDQYRDGKGAKMNIHPWE